MEAIPRITINLDAKCSRCGKSGAASTGGISESGVCLKCLTKQITKEGGMARKVDRDTGEVTDTIPQPPLIAMSEEETRRAGQNLARKVRSLALLRAEHGEVRRAQKMAEERLELEIEGIAESIRTQGSR